MPKTIVIENDEPRLITLNAPGSAPLHLLPGKNDVDADQWNALKSSIGQKGDKKAGKPDGFLYSLLKSRSLFEGSRDEDEEATGVPGTAADAIATVRTTEDIDQLEAWAAAEDRKTVLAAIDQQLSDLTEPVAE